MSKSSCWTPGFKYVPCPGRLEVDEARMLQDSCATVQVLLNPLHCTRLAHGEKQELTNPLALHSKSLMTCFKCRMSGVCHVLLTLQLPFDYCIQEKKFKNIWASKISTVLQRFISLHINPRLVLFFNLVKYLIETFLSLDSWLLF